MTTVKQAESWEGFLELVLERLAHDLAGRSTALSGIRYLAASGDGELEGVIAQEQSRLERMLDMLRAFPTGVDAITIQDPRMLIEPVISIAQWMLLAPRIELTIEPGAPAILGAAVPLQRAALLALGTGARERGMLTVTLSQADGMLLVRVHVGEPGSAAVGEITAWAERGGGTAQVSDDAIDIMVPGV